MKSIFAALTCALALAGTTNALPTISSSDSLSTRSPILIDSVSGVELTEREPLFFGAALKIGLKMGARVYSNWRASKHKRDLEDVEGLESRDVDVLIAMIERSLANEGFGGGSIGARDVGDLDDVLEREVEVETLEDMD